jgi:plasmid stabilization system protein ParE
MIYNVVFHPKAEEEFREAVWWYGNQQNGLDLEFVRCIDEAIQNIKREPVLYPIEFENFRKKVVKRFPFKILYEIVDDNIYILALFHSRRNQEQIRSRNK